MEIYILAAGMMLTIATVYYNFKLIRFINFLSKEIAKDINCINSNINEAFGQIQKIKDNLRTLEHDKLVSKQKKKKV